MSITWEEWTTRRYDCSHCGEENEVEAGAKEFACSYCKQTWIINPDYSFEEGSWRNCTTLTKKV